MQDKQISAMQFFILLFMFIIGSATMLIPSIVTPYTKQDVWISALIAIPITFPLLYLYVSLGKRYPDMTLAQYTEKILGKWFGKVVSFLFFLYFLLITSALLRQMAEMLVTIVMPETPIHAVIIIYFSAIVIAVRLGLETFSRAAEIFFPWVILFLALVMLFLLPLMKAEQLQPIMGSGLGPILYGAFTIVGIPYLDLVIFLMLVPHVPSFQKVKKAYFLSVIIGGGGIIVIAALSIMVLGTELTAVSTYPIYDLAQKVNIAEFIQRIEAFVGAIWIITMFFKTTVCFYAAAATLSQISGLKQQNLLTFPLSLIVIALAGILFPNSVYFFSFAAEIWTPNVTLYGVFLPLLLLIVDTIKTKRQQAGKEDTHGTK
ncbi:MAG: endospore germination permease [Ectobacillus sp.]